MTFAVNFALFCATGIGFAFGFAFACALLTRPKPEPATPIQVFRNFVSSPGWQCTQNEADDLCLQIRAHIARER